MNTKFLFFVNTKHERIYYNDKKKTEKENVNKLKLIKIIRKTKIDKRSI